MHRVYHYCHTSIITVTLLYILSVTVMRCDSNEEIVLFSGLHKILS